MNRSCYEDDGDNWSLIRWRGQVASAIRGRRGQAFLKELLTALDAMPNKRLVPNEFEAAGEVCAMGCIARARGLDMSKLDPDDATEVGDVFGIANPLAREIMYENDMSFWFGPEDDPAARWRHMRRWVAKQIK